MTATTRLPRIYVFCTDDDLALRPGTPEVVGNAVAEDGTMLVQHLCAARIYVRRVMGLTGTGHHVDYENHYPQGYTLVDLTELTMEELDNHEELREVNRRHQGEH